VKRGGFPPLRESSAWYESRAEKRKTLLIAAGLVILFLIASAIGGCNGSHGRC
jgi:hypothetical protein